MAKYWRVPSVPSGLQERAKKGISVSLSNSSVIFKTEFSIGACKKGSRRDLRSFLTYPRSIYLAIPYWVFKRDSRIYFGLLTEWLDVWATTRHVVFPVVWLVCMQIEVYLGLSYLEPNLVTLRQPSEVAAVLIDSRQGSLIWTKSGTTGM